jgi:hypothetical protein
MIHSCSTKKYCSYKHQRARRLNNEGRRSNDGPVYCQKKVSLGESGANNAGPTMYIAIPYDWESESWTSLTPDNLCLKRFIAYARSSAELLTHLIGGEVQEGWKSLFHTP